MSAKSSHGLGKGLGSLIPGDFDSSLLMDSNERIQNLFIADIQPKSDQPRRHFDEQALAELASSIKRYGVLQPLIVSPNGDKYTLVAGERRWRAAQLAGLKRVPAIVRKREELEQLEVSLIENVQRVDLSPFELAVSIERLHSQFDTSYAEVAQSLGKAVSTINNIVRLLQLPPAVVEALQNNKISEGHARSILALKHDPARQAELLKLIIAKSWSVRQAEQFVVSVRDGKPGPSVKVRLSTDTPETKRLSQKLSVTVSIRRMAKGGRLELHFKSGEELSKILKQLLG